MFFNAEQTQGALGATLPDRAPSPQPNRNLSPDQFGRRGPATGAPEAGGAGAAGGEAAAGGAAAEAAEVAPLLLL